MPVRTFAWDQPAARPKLALTFALFVSFYSFARADDWPHLRGPQRNGFSVETGWHDTWPADGPATAWKAKVGLGFSSIAVAEGRAFTLGHADGHRMVFDAACMKICSC